MNKGCLVAIILGVLFGGAFFFVQSQNATISPATYSESTTQADTMMEKSQSRYIPYSASAFDAASGKKRVYYFHAPWCPTCVPTDKEFQANSQRVPEDVVLFKTDYDSSDELKKQYAITYQHTFVLVDENGKEIKKWNGGGLDELIANTQ